MTILIVLIILAMLVLPFIASFKIEWCIYLRSICRLDTSHKEVVLTFDDGPEDKNLPDLLDVLDRKGTKATFFFIGRSVSEYRDLVVRTYQAGHRIGVHTYTHSPWLPFCSVKKITYEILKTKHLIKTIINDDVTLFRPPFGVTNPTISYAVHRSGLKSVGWDIRSFDTVSKSDDQLLAKIERTIRPGSIILLHSNLTGAAKRAERIIEMVEKKGYKIVNL